MAKVQMIGHISGTRDGADWPPAGGILVCPDAEAADLIHAGLARAFDKKLETADAPVGKVETATRKGLTKADLS